MIDQLRIKCPSCGVVLEVKNPRHEAVKRITCPQCKRQMDIDFQEKQPAGKPSSAALCALYLGRQPLQLTEGENSILLTGFEHLKVEVVRISDSSFKYVTSVMSMESTVMLNDERIEVGDKIVMAVGDKLGAAGTVLTFGQPAEDPIPAAPSSVPPPVKPDPPKPKKKILPWLGGGMAFVLVALLVWAFWPAKNHGGVKMTLPKPQHTTERVDVQGEKKTVEEKKEVKIKPTEEQRKVQTVEKKKEPEKKESEKTEPIKKEQTDYDLEVLCAQGNTSAMYQLGRRWVNTGKHRQGVQYLQQAAAAGHAGAKRLLEENNW